MSGTLLASCQTGELDRVRAAITLGVNVNVTNTQDTDKEQIGMTGLMLGIANNHSAIVDLLLAQPTVDKNQTVTTADAVCHGMSALQAACLSGQPWAVARLGREEGLEVNRQGWLGYTPLTLAAYYGIIPVSLPPSTSPR